HLRQKTHPRLFGCRGTGIFETHLKQRVNIAFQKVDLTIHKTLAKFELGIEGERPFCFLIVETYMDGSARLVTKMKLRASRIGDGQIAALDHMVQNSTQHSIHCPISLWD